MGKETDKQSIFGQPITVYFNDDSKVVRKDGKGIAVDNNCLFFIDNFKKSMQIIPIRRIIRIIVKNGSEGTQWD